MQAGRQAVTCRETDRYTHIGIQTEGWPDGLRDRQTWDRQRICIENFQKLHCFRPTEKLCIVMKWSDLC